MSLSKFDMVVEQAKETADSELRSFVDYCLGIRSVGRDFEIVITLHIDTRESHFLHEPSLKLGIDVNPLSPLDKSWQLWLNAEKFPRLTEWARTQPAFQVQIETAVNTLRNEITEREMMITKIIDHWLRPLVEEQGNKTKLELELKAHVNRPKARKS